MKYYVKNKVVNDDLCYLNLVGGSEINLLNNDEPSNDLYQCTFTMQELIDIEKQFAITIVENDNWELEEVEKEETGVWKPKEREDYFVIKTESLCFEDLEILEEAIESVGEDRVKKYYLGVE